MSSIIGIDIGDLYTKAATLTNGVIENLLFNQSNRMNYSYITFKDNNKRLIGSESYNVFKNNIDNSVYSFNSLINNIFLENNQISNQGFSNKNLNDETFIPVKEIEGNEHYLHYIFLSYLELTLKSLGKSFDDNLVLSIPGYFNICDVKFLIDVLDLKECNYHIISQEYAISLDYGFYKSYRKEFKEEKNVLFINIGYNSTQIFTTVFSNDGIKIINTNEINIGGNHFTNRLYDYINKVIFKKYNFNLNDYPKKKILVLKECERVKKQLSTVNSTTFIIDSLIDDTTISEVITREMFENLCQNLVLEILNLLNNIISAEDLKLINSIELLGGGMRIPMIKKSISDRLNKDLSYTLNAEESVSKGCVIYGAINSPQIKKANYKIEKYFSEPIELYLSHYNKPIIVLEKGFNVLPVERSVIIPFNQSFNAKFVSEFKDFMANYQIDTKLNIKDKLEIIIRFSLDNQIDIISYNVKGKTEINIKQLYQTNLESEDKKNIINSLDQVNSFEKKIDTFHESVNILENIYFNSLNLNYLNKNETDDYKYIMEFINKNIIEDTIALSLYDKIIIIKNQLIDLKNKIKSREDVYIEIPNYINQIEKKIEENINNNLKSEENNNFSNWLKEIKTKINKFNVIDIKNEIETKNQEINHLVYDKPHV